MTTATMSRTDAIATLSDLNQQVVDLQTKFDKDMSELGKNIRDAGALLILDEDEDGDENPEPAPAAKRGRPATVNKQAPKNQPKAAKNKNKKAAKAATNGKVSPGERNYANPQGLKKTIWDVLNSEPEQWYTYLTELPADVVGLNVGEIREIIEQEGKWTSSSGDFTTQLSTHLSNFKKEGLIARGSDSRYYIIEGAELTPAKRGRKAADA